MGVVKLVGQILLGVPFAVFAYWYQEEEASYRRVAPQLPSEHTMFRHGVYGLFFSVSFAILGVLFFPPITETITLAACAYLFIRSLDNIEYHKVEKPT
jgi:uncharacterized membrane protein